MMAVSHAVKDSQRDEVIFDSGSFRQVNCGKTFAFPGVGTQFIIQVERVFVKNFGGETGTSWAHVVESLSYPKRVCKGKSV
jgi:hypothetical protein